MNGMIKRRQIAGMNLMYKWYSFAYFLNAMETLGFERISVWGGPPHFDCDWMGVEDCRRIRKMIKDHHLQTAGFLVTGSQYRYQIAVEEKEQIERTYQYFRNGILACEELESPYMSVNSGWGYYSHDREEAFRRSVDMIYRLCEEAGRHQIQIVMENLKSCETNLAVSLADVKRMYEEINHPSFRIMADTGAMIYNKERLEDWFQCFGNRITAIHFVDGMHLAWGDGKSPLDDMMMTLTTHHYEGCLALETSGDRYLANPMEADRKAMSLLGRFMEA